MSKIQSKSMTDWVRVNLFFVMRTIHNCNLNSQSAFKWLDSFKVTANILEKQKICTWMLFLSFIHSIFYYGLINIYYFMITEEPELLLDANMARDHLAMLGTDITLSATIKGVPTPNVSWKKNNGDMPSHITVAVTATGSKVAIPKCVRADSGTYTITVENAAGKKSATVAVLVLSK